MKFKIFNEDCIKTMQNMKKFNHKNDIILTSPPYNTGRPSTSERSRDNNDGTGTTGVACKKLNMNYFGSEISEAQVQYSIDRIKNA